MSQTHPAGWGEDPRKVSLERRLAVLFWPLMFILAGTIWLFPGERIPDGTWLIGIGLILLALNAVRSLNGIPVRVLTTILGALAVAGGLAEYGGMALPLVPLTLIAIGASIILELLPARKA
jgi:hypothetical protein